jgi:hypothetical protein
MLEKFKFLHKITFKVKSYKMDKGNYLKFSIMNLELNMLKSLIFLKNFNNVILSGIFILSIKYPCAQGGYIGKFKP